MANYLISNIVIDKVESLWHIQSGLKNSVVREQIYLV